MILLPFGLHLVTGLFTAVPLMKVLTGLADIALITLLISAAYNRGLAQASPIKKSAQDIQD